MQYFAPEICHGFKNVSTQGLRAILSTVIRPCGLKHTANSVGIKTVFFLKGGCIMQILYVYTRSFNETCYEIRLSIGAS